MSQEREQQQTLSSTQRGVLLRASLVLMLTILAGTFAFQYIEPGWSAEKALYFTLITLTTVGYDDQGIDAAGRWVAIVLMLVGIGTATWAIGQIVQSAVSFQMAWRRRMQHQINKMKRHFLVCGLGRVGTAVCRHLHETGMPFVVIEPDAQRAEWALEQGYPVIDGCGTDDKTLIAAGLHRAQGIVACTSSDAENIMITLSAREISEQVTIVGRANDPDSTHKLQRAGATRVMAPATNAGKDIATYLSNPVLADFLDQTTNAGIGFRLSECMLGDDSELIGQAVGHICDTHPSLVFIAIKHDDGTTRIRPDSDEILREHDILVVVGDETVLTDFFHEAHGEDAYEQRAAG